MIVNAAMIGTTLEDMVNVSSLNDGNMPCPIMDIDVYAKYDDLSSGHVNGGGLPVILWELLHVTPQQADAIALYCPEMTSADVVIYSRKNRNSDEYGYFECIMRWDIDESIATLRRESMKFKFTDCVEVFPGS